MKQKLLKLMCLLCVGMMGMSAWGQSYEKLFSIASGSIVSGSGYKAHTATVDGRSYVITFGGNNASVGTNSSNRSSCNLNSSYSKYAVSPVTTSSVASAFACTTKLDNISKITYIIKGSGSNQSSTNVYLLYSADNTTFSQLSLTSGTQGAAIVTGVQETSFEFSAKSGYFALLFVATNNSGNWRIDDVNISFYKSSSAAATTTTIDASDITNTDVYIGTTAGSLSATVKAGDDAVAGATVTWSGDNDAVATIDENSGAVTLVSAGTVTFTANYAGISETYASSSATYEMTVTSSEPYVEITPNYTFWGKNAQFSGTTYHSLSGTTLNGVELAWESGQSGSTYGNTYASSTAMRFYPRNTLTFTAPTGYQFVSIEITGDLRGDESFSPDGFNTTSQTWTGTSTTVTMSRPSSGSSYAQISKYAITLEKLPSVKTPVFSVTEGYYHDAQNVTITCATDGATIYYTTDGSTPTTSSSVYSAPITVSDKTTIKALASKDAENSNVASALYYIGELTVAEAKEIIDGGVQVGTTYYVKGIISQIDSYNNSYNSITYWISEDGSTTDQFECYSGKGLGGEDFTAETNLQVGDAVVVKGNLNKFGTTYELDKNNELVSMTYTRSVSAGWGTLCLPYDATVEGVQLYEFAGKEMDGSEVKDFVFAEAASVEAGKPYAFKAAAATTLVATYTGSEYKDAGSNKGMVGTYNGVAAGAFSVSGKLYLMTADKVVNANPANSSVGANRAYFDMANVVDYDPSAGVKGIRLGFDGTETPTGIKDLTESTEKTEGTEGIYNLQGQRVNSLQKGINIVGGKKVLVK